MKKAFLFAMTLTGTFIGAGFAGGRELMNFFVMRSPFGIVFYVLSCLLMFYICYCASRENEKGIIKFYEKISGKSIGKAMFFMSLVSLFVCFSASVAGTGSLFYEEFSMGYYEGAVFAVVISMVVCNKGIKRLYCFNGILTPFILIFSVVFGILSALEPGAAVMINNSDAIPSLILPAGYCVAYAGYNIFSLIPVAVGGGDNKPGYLLAFMVTAVAGAFVCLALSVHYETAFLYDLPFFETVRGISVTAEKIYSIVLLFSFLTTAVACFYGFASGLEELLGLSKRVIYIIGTAGLFIMLPMGISGIVGKIYPLVGIAGTAVMFAVLIRFPKK